jgi:hypothetical protein
MAILKKHNIELTEDKILTLKEILNQGRALWFSERLVLKHMVEFIMEATQK